MTHQIKIPQKVVEWTRELSRYYYGDLQDCDSAEWLENVNRLNKEIATEIRFAIRDQLPQERQGV